MKCIEHSCVGRSKLLVLKALRSYSSRVKIRICMCAFVCMTFGFIQITLVEGIHR